MRVLRARSLLCAGLVTATVAAGCNAQTPDRALELAMAQPARFDLEDPPAGLEVQVDVYGKPPLSPI